MNSDPDVQECDATGDDSSTEAGFIKKLNGVDRISDNAP
jgi:hypothetical protein